MYDGLMIRLSVRLSVGLLDRKIRLVLELEAGKGNLERRKERITDLTLPFSDNIAT